MRLPDTLVIDEAYAYTNTQARTVFTFDGATVPAANGGPYPAGPKATATIPAYVSTVSTSAKADSTGALAFVEELRAVITDWPPTLTPLPTDAARFRLRWGTNTLALASAPLRRNRNGRLHHWSLRLK